MRHWIDISGQGHGVVFCSVDAPVADIGAIGYSRFRREVPAESSHLFIRVLDATYREGPTVSRRFEGLPCRSRFVLTTYAGDFAAERAVRFGWEAMNPLCAAASRPAEGRVPAASACPDAAGPALPCSASLCEAGGPVVLLTAMYACGGRYVFRLWNASHEAAPSCVRFPALKVREAWVADLEGKAGERLVPRGDTFDMLFAPHEVVTVLVEVREPEEKAWGKAESAR
ncbi:MAG: hypothetical protein AB1700_13480 [Bacillota bacterium]